MYNGYVFLYYIYSLLEFKHSNIIPLKLNQKGGTKKEKKKIKCY
jgi:hypothetical protein